LKYGIKAMVLSDQRRHSAGLRLRWGGAAMHGDG
jgi:hypothetical protein